MCSLASAGVPPAPGSQPSTIGISRPQPPDEDLSDCAEACGEASGLRSSLASVGHRGRTYGRGEAGIAQPTAANV